MINDFSNIDDYQLSENFADFLKHISHSDEEKERFRDLTIEMAHRFAKRTGVLYDWADDNPIEVIPKGQNRVSKYDIVIHCNSQDEHDEIEKALEGFIPVSEVEEWMSEIKNLKGEYLDDLTDIECSNAWDVAIETVYRIINNHVEHIMEAIEKQFSDQEDEE